MPVICLIDTGGAYPGIGAEERGQAQVIAESMFEMSRLPTPVICVVIGEGGSGGALGIGVGDRVAMLEHAYYSVISPEGCAGILWKSHTFKEQAAEALKMTSKDLSRLGLIDAVIPEPLGGAHRDHHLMASRLKLYLRGTLRELVGKPIDQLFDERYQKFRRMGVFLEGGRPNDTLPQTAFFPRFIALRQPPCCTRPRAGDHTVSDDQIRPNSARHPPRRSTQARRNRGVTSLKPRPPCHQLRSLVRRGIRRIRCWRAHCS